AIASAIVAGVGTLELHAQAICPERVEQAASRPLIEDAATTGPPGPGRRDGAVATGPTHRCATDRRSVGAPGQAYETLSMVQHRLQLDRRLAQHARPGSRRRGGRRDRAVADRPTDRQTVHPTVRLLGPVAGVRMGERDDPAEVAPAALVAHQQREVASA